MSIHQGRYDVLQPSNPRAVASAWDTKEQDETACNYMANICTINQALRHCSGHDRLLKAPLSAISVARDRTDVKVSFSSTVSLFHYVRALYGVERLKLLQVSADDRTVSQVLDGEPTVSSNLSPVYQRKQKSSNSHWKRATTAIPHLTEYPYRTLGTSGKQDSLDRTDSEQHQRRDTKVDG